MKFYNIIAVMDVLVMCGDCTKLVIFKLAVGVSLNDSFETTAVSRYNRKKHTNTQHMTHKTPYDVAS